MAYPHSGVCQHSPNTPSSPAMYILHMQPLLHHLKWQPLWLSTCCVSMPSLSFRCSVSPSCPTLCDPMDCSTPGFPVLHCLPEFAQTHVLSRWCHPFLCPSGNSHSSFKTQLRCHLLKALMFLTHIYRQVDSLCSGSASVIAVTVLLGSCFSPKNYDLQDRGFLLVYIFKACI